MLDSISRVSLKGEIPKEMKFRRKCHVQRFQLTSGLGEESTHPQTGRAWPTFTPRLCPSTAGCSPPSVPSIVLCLLHFCSRWFPRVSVPGCFLVVLFQVVPSFLAMLFCHLLLGHPLDLFPLLCCLSVQRLVHLLPFNLILILPLLS